MTRKKKAAIYNSASKVLRELWVQAMLGVRDGERAIGLQEKHWTGLKRVLRTMLAVTYANAAESKRSQEALEKRVAALEAEAKRKPRLVA